MEMLSGVRTINSKAASKAAIPVNTRLARTELKQGTRNSAQPKVKAAASVSGTMPGSPTMLLPCNPLGLTPAPQPPLARLVRGQPERP